MLDAAGMFVDDWDFRVSTGVAVDTPDGGCELYDVAVAEENVQAVINTLVAAGYRVLAPVIVTEEFYGITQRVAYLKGDPDEAALPRQ
ncbi:hypothetical protein [Cryobacterium sp. 5B3]|uniref:hypothetical protein n=1 Tax=Cryobacterium sp. 5B3 TaxID=3048586 RepID=UPI002AB477B3|nr:hypothetical protein [Cryobacterium sp. 5B3]MDY7544618.1 hypothetical protein [Cryobacterium sp. 5B3]MEB0276219.1 hypothetical protein [Cryobacterium sp. 5B3]